MSATPADDVQTSPTWNCDCKGTIIFWIEQENRLKLAKLFGGGGMGGKIEGSEVRKKIG